MSLVVSYGGQKSSSLAELETSVSPCSSAQHCNQATPPTPTPTQTLPPGGWRQGLTLVHFSAQPEPFLTQKTP